MSAGSTADWAVRYIEKYRLALVQIPPGHKSPLHDGWNRPGGFVTDASEARQRWSDLPDHGIGVVLGPSGLCSADIDAPEYALPALADLGVDLGAVQKGAPTIQGNPTRWRSMFRAPPGVALGSKKLVWPAKAPGEKPLTILELPGRGRSGCLSTDRPPRDRQDL